MRACTECPGIASSPQQALLQRSPSSQSTRSPQLLGGPGRDADTALNKAQRQESSFLSILLPTSRRKSPRGADMPWTPHSGCLSYLHSKAGEKFPLSGQAAGWKPDFGETLHVLCVHFHSNLLFTTCDIGFSSYGVI